MMKSILIYEINFIVYLFIDYSIKCPENETYHVSNQTNHCRLGCRTGELKLEFECPKLGLTSEWHCSN